MRLSTAKLVRYLLAGGVVAILLAVALWPAATRVDTAVATRGRVANVIEAEGVTRIHDRYLITAPIPGELHRPTLHAGDPVRAGDVLVVMAPLRAPSLDRRARSEALARADAARSRASAAREAASAAETAVRLAARDVDRLRPLAAQQLVAASDLERAVLTHQRAQRESASARFLQATATHELDVALASLERGGAHDAAVLEITAPVDGVILRRYVDSAQPVAAGAPLFEIGDPAGMEVAVDVLSTDAERLRPGMPVQMAHGGTGAPLQGVVRTVEPGGFTKVSALGVEEQRAWVIVDFTGTRETLPRLGDAYRVEASFLVRAADDVLRVPTSAVNLHDHQPFVFRILDGKGVFTPVRTGLVGGGNVEITSGLQPGDRVIVHPDRSLEDGVRVKY